MKKIMVRPPAMVAKGSVESHFDALDYSVNIAAPRMIRNATVTRCGIVFRNGLPLADSMYSHFPAVVKHFGVGAASFVLHKKSKLDSGRIYTSGHTIWSKGYFHWVTESLPRLVMARNSFDVDSAVVPNYGKGSNFFAESISAIGIDDVVEIMPGRSFLVPEMAFSPAPPRKAEFDPAAMMAMRDSVLKNSGKTHSPSRKIYVSRSRARNRKVVNEQQVMAVLEKFGYEFFNFEGLGFMEQVAIMSETKSLVSIHGAGLSNMAFMPQGGNVVELVPDPLKLKKYAQVSRSYLASPTYCRLASVFDHAYYALISEPHGDNAASSDIVVDIHDLETALRGIS